MEIDKNGEVISHRIVKSVIKTNERMTYTNVSKILTEPDDEILERYTELVPMLKTWKHLEIFCLKREKKEVL